MTITRHGRYTVITGQDRTHLATALADGYRNGATIRQLAARHRLRYAQTRALLLEAGTVLRPTGWNTHR